VLFDRTTFSDLHQLTGDQGGRSLFDRYQATWVEWTESAMLDLDTPEDLQRLRDRE
jgi:CTP:molybdopterin cytidylyltransferase MocA